jgi:hypothetical protein
MRLRGVTYNRKNDGKRQVGVVAEEVAAVIPEIASFNGREVQGVDYSRLSAVLIQAIKEQQKEIAGLQGELQKQRAEQRVGAGKKSEACTAKSLEYGGARLERKGDAHRPQAICASSSGRQLDRAQ